MWAAVLDLERGVTTTIGKSRSTYTSSAVWAPGEQGVIAVAETGGVFSFDAYPVGGGPASPLFEGESGFEYSADSVTPDGKTLLFTKWPRSDKAGEIMTFSLGETRPAKTVMETPDNERVPRISPSGDYVAYYGTGQSGGALMVVSYPTPSAPVQVSTSRTDGANWWLSANELGWMDRSRRLWKATVTARDGRLDVGVPQPLFGDVPLERDVKILAYDIPRERFVIAIMDAPREDPRLVVVTDWRPDILGAR